MTLSTTDCMDAAEARRYIDAINESFGNVRAMLLDLREREGWRALGYDSWRACVVKEFGQSKTHLYRQLDAAEIEREISPIGEIGAIKESHLRPLSALPSPEARREAWDEANRTAPGGKVTAAHVEAVVEQKLPPKPYLPRTEASKPEPEPEEDFSDYEPSEEQVAAFHAYAADVIEEAQRDDPTPLPRYAEDRSVYTQALREQEASGRAFHTGIAAVPGAKERIERAGNRRLFMGEIRRTSGGLLPLIPPAYMDALEGEDFAVAREFIRECRRWLDALETELTMPLRAVK